MQHDSLTPHKELYNNCTFAVEIDVCIAFEVYTLQCMGVQNGLAHSVQRTQERMEMHNKIKLVPYGD